MEPTTLNPSTTTSSHTFLVPSETLRMMFTQLGEQDGRGGLPMLDGPDAPIFLAYQQDMLLSIQTVAAKNQAVAETEVSAKKLHAEERRTAASAPSLQPHIVGMDLSLSSRSRWLYWTLAIAALLGELPLAFQMFVFIIGGEELPDKMEFLQWVIPSFGALGFVGCTAAVKVILDWLLNRLFVPRKASQGVLLWLNKLVMLVVIVVGASLFYQFAGAVGNYRHDLEATKQAEFAFIEASQGVIDSTTTKLLNSTAQEVQLSAAQLEESTTTFFIRFGYLFPFAAGVLAIEAEARGRRRRAKRQLEAAQAALDQEAPQIAEYIRLASRQLAEANATLAALKTAGLGDAWRHQFWSAYRIGYQQGQYAPDRISHGPGLFEKVEATRMKMNLQPALS